MVELFEHDGTRTDYHSSKGNQLKWNNGGYWYKADYTGYEGFAEHLISHLLQYSSLSKEEYCIYDTEQIRYQKKVFLGCHSKDFLPENWRIITLERLFQQNRRGNSLNKSIHQISDETERLKFLVDQTIQITGLRDFGKYMSKLLTVDALFLNEDRHTHNIAVLEDDHGIYHYCPIFDNGASLLSDTTMDYPMEEDVYQLIPKAKAKTIDGDFAKQLDVAEHLYGQNLTFCFSKKEVEELLQKESYYDSEIKKRAMEIIMYQRRKYEYLFL